MNRRALFSFLGVAPLALPAMASPQADPRIPRVARGDKTCKCGCHLYYYRAKGGETACLWCKGPWPHAADELA
jgi:hypothetical protein